MGADQSSAVEGLFRGDGLSAEAAWLDQAVLAYGPRKGGTTLFQNLLDGGDQLFAYPGELKLKSFVKNPADRDIVARYVAVSRIPEMESARFPTDEYNRMWRDRERDDDWRPSLRDLIRFDIATVFTLCRSRPERIEKWCAKEVGGDTESILSLWRRMFPQGKVLFIVRDPRLITRAVLQDRRRKAFRPSLRKLIYETLDPLRVVAAAARHSKDPDIYFVAYEDLVREPEAVMAGVAAYLGIDQASAFRYPSIFGDKVVVSTSSRNEADIFVDDKHWTDGLTRREKIVVGCTLLFSRFSPRHRVDYPALRRQLAERAGARSTK